MNHILKYAESRRLDSHGSNQEIHSQSFIAEPIDRFAPPLVIQFAESCIASWHETQCIHAFQFFAVAAQRFKFRQPSQVIFAPQVQSKSRQVGGARDEGNEARQAEEWPQRQESHQPQTGDRHRPVGGAPFRCEGSAQESSVILLFKGE